MGDACEDGVLARVRALVAEVAGVDAVEVDEDAPLFEEEGGGDGLCLDSLDALRLGLALAEEYGLEYEPKEVQYDRLRTVRDIAAYVAAVTGNGGAS